MEKYEIEKLRDLSIEEVAEQLGLQVNAHHKALCPFHDDHHASFSFNTRKNTCRCFVCMEKSMDTIALVMKYKRVDFLVACHWLADKFFIPIKGRKPAWAYQAKPPSGNGTSPSGTGVSPSGAGASSPSIETSSANGVMLAPHFFDASRYARFFEHPWLSDEARRFLFEERKIDERVVRWCRLTSWSDRDGTHWLQTPYFDIDGKLIGIQNRNLDYQKLSGKEGKIEDKKAEGRKAEGKNVESKKAEGKNAKERKPRFRFPFGAKCSIYNLPVINRLKPGDELYITEGCSDCWAMLSAGHKAIAIPSATLLSPEDKLLLADLSHRLSISWHIYPDKDVPGERLFLQLKELLPSLVHHQLPLGCKDFGEYFKLKF